MAALSSGGGLSLAAGGCQWEERALAATLGDATGSIVFGPSAGPDGMRDRSIIESLEHLEEHVGQITDYDTDSKCEKPHENDHGSSTVGRPASQVGTPELRYLRACLNTCTQRSNSPIASADEMSITRPLREAY